MMVRLQVTFSSEQHRRVRARAAELGISAAAYVRGLVARDLAGDDVAVDVSPLIGLGDSGGSDVARDKDRYVGDAVAARP